MFLTLKALHIVAVVSWFSGLFYIVRLFVYLRETQDRSATERDVLQTQLELMASRLWYGITWPAGIATLGLGLALLPYFWPPPLWLQLKLGLVGILVGYHLGCHWMYRELTARRPVLSSRFLRIWNELATLLLVGIVFLVVLKSGMSLVWGTVGMVVFSAALMAGIIGYRKIRNS